MQIESSNQPHHIDAALCGTVPGAPAAPFPQVCYAKSKLNITGQMREVLGRDHNLHCAKALYKLLIEQLMLRRRPTIAVAILTELPDDVVRGDLICFFASVIDADVDDADRDRVLLELERRIQRRRDHLRERLGAPRLPDAADQALDPAADINPQLLAKVTESLCFFERDSVTVFSRNYAWREGQDYLVILYILPARAGPMREQIKESGALLMLRTAACLADPGTLIFTLNNVGTWREPMHPYFIFASFGLDHEPENAVLRIEQLEAAAHLEAAAREMRALG